jgi:hypothetical protein
MVESVFEIDLLVRHAGISIFGFPQTEFSGMCQEFTIVNALEREIGIHENRPILTKYDSWLKIITLSKTDQVK